MRLYMCVGVCVRRHRRARAQVTILVGLWSAPRDALLREYQVISSDGAQPEVPGESIAREVARAAGLREDWQTPV